MAYKIGEFSNITQLSVKTLRYYHDNDILEPSSVDEESGYRYYNNDSYERAKLIKLLRDFDFSIKEIKEVLESYEDESDIKAYLLEKNDMIQEKINHYKKLQSRIEHYQTYKEAAKMLNQVKEITIDNMIIVSLTYVGRYGDVGDYLGKLFKAAGMNVNGKPFCIYHDEEYKEEDATVEVCVPLRKEVVYKGFETKVLEGGKAISILHIGSYESLSDSYKVLTDYIKDNNIETKSPIREHYIKGPGMLLKGNPKKYQTDIKVLI